MARQAQYSRARRLVMQVTMGCILLATLGLGALLARSRERARAVELVAKPHWAGPLAIRLPKGWSIRQDEDELPIEVIATDPAKIELTDLRSVVVYQTATIGGSPGELLRKYISNVPGNLGRLQSFSILGHPGILARFESLHPIPEHPHGGTFTIPGWYAAGVVPDAGPDGSDLGIVIGAHGFGTAGPAGRRLVRQVADGLSLRPQSPAATALLGK